MEMLDTLTATMSGAVREQVQSFAQDAVSTAKDTAADVASSVTKGEPANQADAAQPMPKPQAVGASEPALATHNGHHQAVAPRQPIP